MSSDPFDSFDVDDEFARIVDEYGDAPDASAFDFLEQQVEQLDELEEVPPIDEFHVALGDEGHYIPPDPGPITLPDPPRMLSWVALFGGPLVMLGMLVLQMQPPGWVTGLLALSFVGGFVGLVLTMHSGSHGSGGPHDPWSGDDGAVL